MSNRNTHLTRAGGSFPIYLMLLNTNLYTSVSASSDPTAHRLRNVAENTTGHRRRGQQNEFYQSRILPIAVHGFCVLRRSAEPIPRVGGLGRTQKVKAHGARDGAEVRCAAETAPHAPPQMRRARRTVRSPRVLRRTCDTRSWAVERRVNATGDPHPSRPSRRRRQCRGP